MALETYRKKRKFDSTNEPAGAAPAPSGAGRFVIQKHAARRLHYDLRLEIDGVLRSWAVPKGPSLDPAAKRLAVRTEDHPIEYLTFEKVIPEGNYGAGAMIIWDHGTFEVEGDVSARKQLEGGELKLVFYGVKISGGFALVKTKGKSRDKGKQEEWLLIKHRDAAVEAGYDIEARPESVTTGRTIEDLFAGAPPGRPAGLTAAAIEGAEESEPPWDATPTLAMAREKPFSDPDWLFEIKWDGVRLLAHVDGGRLRLITRNGRDVTSHYPELADLPLKVRARQAILDGEVVAIDTRGRSDFGRLQKRMHVDKPSRAQIEDTPVHFYVFDLLYADGYDLRDAALVDRKRYLRDMLVRNAEPVRFSDHVVERGEDVFAAAEAHGAEGIVAKRAQSGYPGARTADWLKIKALEEIDAVVGGWTAPRGGRGDLGALLLGFFGRKGLQFAGGVGTGFTNETLAAIGGLVRRAEAKRCPFTETPVTKEKAHWTRPELVARVRYSGWARDGGLRHPVFLGLRDDVDPGECKDPREAAPREPETPKAAPASAPRIVKDSTLRTRKQLEAELFGGKRETVQVDVEGKPFRLTHLDKIYFPEPGYRKRDVLAYYYRIAEKILPFLEHRPLVLRRFPNGINGESFYQKDIGEGVPEWIETVIIPSESSQRDTRYYVCNDVWTLLHLVNLGCIEQHPWPSRTDDLEKPDYVFFDLDPSEGYEFETVIKVARTFLKILDEIGAKVYPKTSGSRGIHIWLPLVREYTYEQARDFAQVVARIVHDEMPKETTLERRVEKRPKGTIYLDYLQNSYGKPLATAYTVRPKPLATVSTPLAPTELRKGFSPEKLTIETVPKRAAGKKDPWGDFWESRQRIEDLIGKIRDWMG
jgi:bifunctional non-homologous end joining protein LigD